MAPAAAQSVTSSFTGATLADTLAVPPDSMGAAGPSQFLLGLNGRIRSFNKVTTTLDPPTFDFTMDNFFTSVRTPGFSVTDPRVRFDRLSGRWIVVAIDKATTNNRVLFAVSSGPVLTTSTAFNFFSFPQNVVGPAGDTGFFADYPSLGVDANALYIGVNQFNGKTGPFVGTSAFVVRKSSILGTGPIVATAFRNLTGTPGGPGPAAPQGVDNLWDPSATTGYFIGVNNEDFDTLVLRRVSDPGGTPTISSNILVDLPGTTSFPVDVPHPGNTTGTNGYLDGTDDRLLSATLRNGRLWTSQSIAVNSQGTPVMSGTDLRDGSRWYEVADLNTAPFVAQFGTLFDPTVTSTPRHYWIPTVMVSGQGHMALGASTGGATVPTDAVTAGRLATDAPGSLQAPAIYASNPTATYNPSGDPGSSSGRRWGDYSYTSLDPNDDMTMWTVQEFVNANNSYGVQVARLTAPPPATPVAASPSSLSPGQPSTIITVTGSGAGGAGFYDPGAGFPSRLSASVSGGVTVNQVTYLNPTTISLNVSTVGAPLGTKTVTVTNPDGQVSAGAVLEVQVPSLSVGDRSAAEGNAGTTELRFPVSLSSSSPVPVQVGFTTADGSAMAGDGDYRSASGTLTFTPNGPPQDIVVTVEGDSRIEPDETFSVRLFNPAGASLARSAATGVILNDDFPPAPPPPPPPPPRGYRLVARDGGIFAFGSAPFLGSTGAIRLNQPIVGMASTPTGNGYWLVASDGGIFAFGDATFRGSTGAIRLNRPIVAMASTPTGNGYWLVASDGGIFAFGDAAFRGSTGAITLNRPIVGMASTPSGNGYWLVASDGGIFAFGDARFFGSTGAITLNRPIVGMASTPSGSGYWLVASDGGIFAFGDARFFGSTGSLSLVQPIVGMASTPSGNGYWLVASDGGIFAFGDAVFRGSTGAIRLNQPIVAMASTPSGNGYWLVASDGGIFAFGDAAFFGSTGGLKLVQPIVGISS
ncbi:MAG TPA: Calx-beta domain-containing protein [Acidimicrobiales bacterium]|nr:Calx-beta domain-containing protein [Acidimicrobiales bacterium]